MNKFTILEQEIMQDVSISNELCLQQIFKLTQAVFDNKMFQCKERRA